MDQFDGELCTLYSLQKGSQNGLLIIMQEVLNFTYTLRKPTDRQWGSLQSDGSWTGMINEVHQKRIDMGNSDFIDKIITNY